MRVIESDGGMAVKNMKCYDEGGNIRLTFGWPAGIEQVYVFARAGGGDGTSAAKAPSVEADGTGGLTGGKLFTLQEYKKRGGYILRKTPGVTTYYIYPFLRENGEDICYARPESQITCTGRTTIDFTLREKTGGRGRRYKSLEISLSADYPVAPGVISYVKKANGYPRDINDGIEYNFGEGLEPGRRVARVVRTLDNEYLRLFTRDALYSLRG